MTKFTPEYIAECRKAKGGVWVFLEAKAALDEIELLLARNIKLATQNVEVVGMVEKLIEVGDGLKYSMKSGVSGFGLNELMAISNWDALTSEWWAQ